ncbi:MAG: TRAP transporter small permease subunit [Thermodesulfobacteriota bacterium]
MKNYIWKFTEKVEGLNRILYLLSAVAILVSALILTYEVVMRYLFRTPTIWEIEASVYLMIMATFLGAAYGLKDGAHIKIDLITRLLPPSVNSWLSLITSYFSFGFCLLLAWRGWAMWWEAFSKGWRSESLWSVPLAIPYFCLPLGMSLLSIQYVREITKLQKLEK